MNQPFGYYAPPESGGRLPPAVVLFRVYAALMAVAYGAVAAALVSADGAERVGMDVVYLVAVVPVVLAIAHALAAFVPREPWGWTLGVIVLAVGLPSCGIALAFPLLVFWLRPECRAAFRRF